MTTVDIHSLTQTGIIRSADAAAKAQKAVMVVISAKWLKQMIQRHRSRQQLAQLSDHLLADIGLTEAQRQAELRKPLWNGIRESHSEKPGPGR